MIAAKDRRRVMIAAAIACGGAAVSGCTAGSGSGAAAGPLWYTGCQDGQDYGTQAMPANFDLAPSFFAGDPIEDSSPATHINRLVIRMQRTGQAVEYNDTLFFDVENSYEIARCVRGQTVNGVGQWDMSDMGLGPWCDWSGGGFTDGGIADGGSPLDGGLLDGGAVDSPLIRITSQGYMQSSLQLLATCPLNVVTASGTALAGHAVDGWIQFADFGTAAQPDVSSEERTPVPTDFKVNFGDRLRAKFHVALEDDRVVTAEQTQPTGPIPAPLMGATLDGYFDFDLVRGRAAQPFP